MEHFDDMLRNSIANDYPENRFEFREEYWLQAQALIESYERKRKRRAIFRVFAGLLVTTAVVWYFYDGSTPQQTTPAGVQPAVQETLQPPMAVQQDATTTTGTNEPVQQTSTTDNNAASSGHPTTTTNTTLNSSNPSNSTTPNNNTLQKRIANNISENKTHTANTYGSSQKTALQTPPPGLQPDAGSPSPELPGTANTTAAAGRMQVANAIESRAFRSVSSLSPAKQPALNILPQTSPDAMADGSPITKKARANKWHGGLTFLAGTSGDFLNKANFSAGIGIANQFRINQKWSVNTDLLWRRRKGATQQFYTGLPGNNNEDALIAEEQIITYSFGYQQSVTTTRLEAMHFAELPVYVSRHFGKLTVDAGGLITTPLLSKTQKERKESSSLNNIATTTDAARQYQLNTQDIGSSILPGLIAGINFEPFRNLSFGVRGTYMLSQKNYTLSLSDATLEPLILNRSLSSFSADLRVKWLF